MFDSKHHPGKSTLTQGLSRAHDEVRIQDPGKQSLVEERLGAKVHRGPAAASGTTPTRAEPHGYMIAHHESDGQIHIITDAGLRHLRQSGKKGRHAAEVLFDNPHAYIVLKDGQHKPDGWRGRATVLYPSYAAFQAAVAENDSTLASADAVVYDNEDWAQTPPNEKQDPGAYAKLFMELAHQRNLKFIAAPTQKFFAADARYADIIDIQLQGREYHVDSYLHALRRDIKLAHRENSDIKVVGQISSNTTRLEPDHHVPIGKAINHAERDIVEGENPPPGHHIPQLDGFWGYLYQGHYNSAKRHSSIKAGVRILEDLSDKEEKGIKKI